MTTLELLNIDYTMPVRNTALIQYQYLKVVDEHVDACHLDTLVSWVRDC